MRSRGSQGRGCAAPAEGREVSKERLRDGRRRQRRSAMPSALFRRRPQPEQHRFAPSPPEERHWHRGRPRRQGDAQVPLKRRALVAQRHRPGDGLVGGGGERRVHWQLLSGAVLAPSWSGVGRLYPERAGTGRHTTGRCQGRGVKANRPAPLQVPAGRGATGDPRLIRPACAAGDGRLPARAGRWPPAPCWPARARRRSGDRRGRWSCRYPS